MRDPAALIASALVRMPPAARAPFLRDVLAHAAAGLVVIHGADAALTIIYDLGDAVVLKGERVGEMAGRAA
jgi:hypothetical protein